MKLNFAESQHLKTFKGMDLDFRREIGLHSKDFARISCSNFFLRVSGSDVKLLIKWNLFLHFYSSQNDGALITFFQQLLKMIWFGLHLENKYFAIDGKHHLLIAMFTTILLDKTCSKQTQKLQKIEIAHNTK